MHRSTVSYVPSLSTNREDHTLAYFFHNYVINSAKYHPSLEHSDNKHLLASIQAFGMAGIAKYHSTDRRLLYSARRHYVEALGGINSALQDEHRAIQDETLLAILVVTNYETLTGGVTRGLEAWEQHINGASALLNLRGTKGIEHSGGRVLTLQIITFINVVCLLKVLPTPPYIHELQAKISEYLYEPESPAVRYQSVNLECADFRHDVMHGLVSSIEDIMLRTAELDAKLLAAFENPPPSWEAKTVPELVDTETIHNRELPDFEIKYADQSTNHIWTAFASSRIMLHELVLRKLEDMDSHGNSNEVYRSAKLNSLSIVKACQTQILASMPHFMFHSSHLARPVRYHVSEALESDLPTMRVLAGYGVMWPLLVAGTCSTATSAIRNYVKQVYRFFGEELRIEQALVLCKML